MKRYIAIGHWSDSENIISLVIIMRKTFAAMMKCWPALAQYRRCFITLL